MTILANAQPFPLFFDKVGVPLSGGSVYFGQPNQNPETAPVTVYWDVAGTQPAPQPLKTVSGYIVRNGTPSLVYINGDYSITVKAKNGTLLFYAPSSASIDNSQVIAAQLSLPSGSSSIGFIQAGSGAVAQTVQDQLRERVSITQFGAGASNIASVNTAAIQAAVAYLVGAGGGTLLVPKATSPYLISDTITVGSNVRIEFEQYWQLTTASSNGSVLLINGSNVEIINPLIDGGGSASNAGENGIGIIGGNNIQVRGGKIRNCFRGGVGNMFGGKGVQIEAGGVEGVLVDGTEFSNCFMAMSTKRDALAVTAPDYGIQFTNITANNCEILFFVRQANVNDTTGAQHTVQLNGFYAVQCGSFEGALQFSRAANVQVSNGVIINTGSPITALIRGNHRYCRFDNIRFSGDCTSLISIDPSTFAPDSSYVCTDNTYDINYSGACSYLAYADVTTPNRILQNSYLKSVVSSDVAVKIVGDELRNGYCVLDLQIAQKSIITTTAAFYLEGRTNFASYPAGVSLPRFNSGQITFPATQVPSADPNTLDDYEEGTWTPADASGAGLAFTSAYGDYTKVGRMVFASFSVTYPATASGSNATISGLPYASANISGRVTSGFAIRYTDVGSPVTCLNNPGALTFLLANGSSGVIFTNANMSTKTVQGVISYMTAT